VRVYYMMDAEQKNNRLNLTTFGKNSSFHLKRPLVDV